MIWNLIDINFYTEASTFFASEYEGKNSFYLIGDNYNGWNYGTLINFAPMGIELYFNNYIKFMNKLNILSIRFTYPLDSFGIGIYFSDIITFFNFKLDLNLDFWNQYYYGLGIGVITEIKYNIFDNISIHTKIGWKSDGYMIGLTTKNSPIFSLGVKYKL